MRTRTLFAGAAVVGATLLGVAAPALAAPDPSPSPSTSSSPTPTPSTSGKPTPERWALVDPAKVRPGGRVNVYGACFGKEGATAESTAFGRVHLKRTEKGAWSSVTVRADAKPGQYAVKVTCLGDGGGGKGGETTLTVLPAQTKRVPRGGVAAGGGGTQHDDATLPLAGVVLAVTGAAAGVGMLRLRRRARA